MRYARCLEKCPDSRPQSAAELLDNFEAHVTYARWLTQRGEVGAALAEFQRTRKLERISALVSAWTSYLLYLNGQTDSALVESARAFQLDSTQLATMNWGAWVNVATGSRMRNVLASLSQLETRRPPWPR